MLLRKLGTNWRKKVVRWLLVALTLTLLSVRSCPPVRAATAVDVTITAIPNYVTGFSVLLLSDTQVLVSWTIPPEADRMMIRAKYGGYPESAPVLGAEPTDGYLVYFGNALSVFDRSMNMDTAATQLYYRAWKVSPAGVYTIYDGDFVEGIGMTLLALALLAIGLTVAMFATREMMLGFPCVLFWSVLGGYSYLQSVSPWGDWQYFLFFASMGMVIFSLIAMFALQKKDLNPPRKDWLDSGKFIDEGSTTNRKPAGRESYDRESESSYTANGYGEDEQDMEAPSRPSRRTRELRRRAYERRSGNASRRSPSYGEFK